jgi:NADP-dependent 3-hydroxy acid dehydrogenase YdfG
LVQAQQLSLSTMRCAPSRTAKEALWAAPAIADAIAFAIGQPPEVDVNEIIVRPWSQARTNPAQPLTGKAR